jgi:LmbE family N-acetylglucosaminyl deacetylase
MKTTPENVSGRAAPEGTDVGVLLGVWAHPDDEAYMSAGLMATARDAGHRVVVATATKGELGTEEPDLFPPERLAGIRERETLASLAALDVREHRWLRHRDGGLDRVATARGVGQVRDLIDEVQPDTIVTFGPDGMTGHADHRAVCRWVTTAWRRSGRPCRLWYATVAPEFHRDWTDVNSAVGFWFSGTTPPCDPSSELAFTVTCDESTLDRKLVALRAHASQTTPLIEQIGHERYRRWWSTESFVDAVTHERRAAA